MERIVQSIVSAAPTLPQATRVAAYARVSSGKDAMLHSLSSQISQYSEMIQQHPGWLYCGVYSDEAISGTKDSRAGFQALLRECRAGKIDLVIVKSISRFARNTVTLLESVRELRSLGVDVFFEGQNIHTASSEGELMLTILASYAQEEALSVSENQKWRVKKNFEEGKPWNTTMLGYRYRGGTLVIEPEEAEIVRRIFAEYLRGKGAEAVARELNADGFRSRFGKAWTRTSVFRVLRNDGYTGNLLLQKTYSENHMTKRKMRNDGVLPMYYAEGTHEAIIPMELFEQVQTEIARRAEKHSPVGKPHSKRYPFSGKIVCACCGNHYRRKVTKTSPVWICDTFNTKGKAACPSKQIPERVLEDMATELGEIGEITACGGNRLVFGMADGTEVERTWADRSRSESWTPEMREKAAAQTKARYRK